jgi:hypothetical protein
LAPACACGRQRVEVVSAAQRCVGPTRQRDDARPE